jgi:mycofactocin precursor
MSDDQTAVIEQDTENAEQPDVTLDEVLVEEVSIDGMCGVY